MIQWKCHLNSFVFTIQWNTRKDGARRMNRDKELHKARPQQKRPPTLWTPNQISLTGRTQRRASPTKRSAQEGLCLGGAEQNTRLAASSRTGAEGGVLEKVNVGKLLQYCIFMQMSASQKWNRSNVYITERETWELQTAACISVVDRMRSLSEISIQERGD